MAARPRPVPRPKLVFDRDERRGIMRRLERLRTNRNSWYQDALDIANYTNPERFRRDVSDKDRHISRSRILNDAASQAARVTKAGLYAGTCSSSTRWFALTTPDPQLAEFGSVKTWLSIATDRLYTLFANSNTYLSLQESIGDVVDFGNSPIVVDDDYEDVINATVLPPGEWFWFLDERGNIGGVYREATFTVEYLIREFGYENCASRTRQMYDGGDYDNLIECLEVWQRNDNMLPSLPNRPSDPYVHILFEKGASDDDVLRVRGMRTWPIPCARWDVRSGDVYARGPGRYAIADVRQLQSLTRSAGGLVQVALKPAVAVPNSLKEYRSGVTDPGFVLNYDGAAAGSAVARAIYEPNPNWVQYVDAIAQRTEQRIDRAYYADLFRAVLNDQRDQRATAREIAEVHEEKMVQAGPALERLHTDLLGRYVTIGFDALAAAGLLPPPPREVAGQQLKVRYTSVMAQAQQMVGLGSIERLGALIGPWAPVKPEMADKVNGDELVDTFADMAGIPVRVINDDEQVAAIRARRAQDQANVNAAAMAGQAAQAGKVLSETNLAGDSALTRMIATGQGA